MTTSQRLLLDYVYEHEVKLAQHVYLTQPIGNGQVKEYTWAQVMNEARRMATHLQSIGLQRGDRVAMLSKNCAHFFIAELAIWMGGFTTVAIFPTEGASTIQYVLEHSESKAIFIGKLDPTWPEQEKGVPASLKRIALPLGPTGPEAGERWDDIMAKAKPI
ncbi:MAG TPA: AMP-binding protein, partial [Archangium sp.]